MTRLPSEPNRYILSREVQELIGHEAITSPASVAHYDVPIEVDSPEHDGEISVHLSIADVKDPIGVGIMPASWSDFGGRHFQKIRLGSVATFTGLRMIGLDFPGMGDHINGRTNEFTPADYEDMRRGRLTSIADRSWRAIEATGALKRGNSTLPIALLGHSLSSLTVAELAATMPEGLDLTDINTSEIMALNKRSKLILGVQFPTKGAKYLTDYTKMNQGAPEANEASVNIVSQFTAQFKSHIKAFTVLTKGQHPQAIDEAMASGRINGDKEHGTRHHIVAAANGLSPASSARRFHESLLTKGMPGSLAQWSLLNGEYHGWQDSLPALLSQMSKLAIVEAAQ